MYYTQHDFNVILVSLIFAGDEFSESMKRNQMLASTAIKRAMSDANAGKMRYISK